MPTDTLLLIRIFSALVCLACGIAALGDHRRHAALVSPLMLFLGMAVIDVFLPPTVFAMGAIDLPAWVSPRVLGSASASLVVFGVAVLFYYCGYRLIEAWLSPADERPYGTLVSAPSVPMAAALVGLSLFAYGLFLLRDIVTAGSITVWLARALTDRFRAERAFESGHLLQVIRSMCIPVMFIATGALFMQRRKRPVLFGIVVPAVVGLVALSTFLRGTLLTLLLGLAAISSDAALSSSPQGRNGAVVRSRRRAQVLVAVAVGLFVVFTFARDFAIASVGGSAPTARLLTDRFQRLARGESWLGLMMIMSEFPRPHRFLEGQTITDMLLLPIPRALWAGKPAWYGIDNITRSMGYPETTQTPVSMPGELFANFGYAGIVFMLVYGAVFALFHAYRRRAEFRLAYAFVILPAVLTTFWMGFTGFVNSMIQLPVILVISTILFAAGSMEHRSTAPRLAPEGEPTG